MVKRIKRLHIDHNLLLLYFTMVCSLTLCSQKANAQGILERAKSGVSKVWHSETVEKIKNSESLKSASAYIDSKRYTVPVTGRRFIDVIPDNYLLQMSQQQYKQYLNHNTKSSNSKKQAQVRRVAERLSREAEKLLRENGLEGELKNYNWEFNLVHNNTANAFCMPGGKIVVYDGILSVANDDASLAIVIGHEIAHAIAKHSAEQMTKRIIAACGIAVVYSVIIDSDMSSRKKRLASIMTTAGVTLADLKYSRMNETEADRLGLIIAAKAGYNPEVAVTFWQKMANESHNKSTHDWYSDHPSPSNRITNIKKFLPEAKQYYSK